MVNDLQLFGTLLESRQLHFFFLLLFEQTRGIDC